MVGSPNFDYIKKLSDGNTEFEKKIMTVIKRELPLEIHSYQENMKEKEFEEAAEIIHKIKHKLGIFQMEDAYALAVEYEETLRAKDTSLKDKFEIYLGQLESFVESCEI